MADEAAPGPSIVTIFRSRLRDDAYANGYEEHNNAMVERVHTMPGLIEFTSYVAADGERVSVIVFASRDDHDRWARDPEHRLAQSAGRDTYYAEFRTTVAEVTKERPWSR